VSPDITMCQRTDCPSRDKCWRYRTTEKMATTGGEYQSYFTPELAGDKCEYFIPKEEK
jgi:hypothetical protein